MPNLAHWLMHHQLNLKLVKSESILLLILIHTQSCLELFWIMGNFSKQICGYIFCVFFQKNYNSSFPTHFFFLLFRMWDNKVVVFGLWLKTEFREQTKKKNQNGKDYIGEIRHIIWKINVLTNRYFKITSILFI